MNGFLGTRASFALDFVVLGMALTLPLMCLSVGLVRWHQNFKYHKRLQTTLAGVLLCAVVLFEIEMRLYGWTDRAVGSPFWQDGRFNDWIDYSLTVHLLFAIPTPFLWGFVIYGALRGFPKPPSPSGHSSTHRFWGRLAMLAMTATAVTGWLFYYLAFAAK